jgi:hypothetical protein
MLKIQVCGLPSQFTGYFGGIMKFKYTCETKSIASSTLVCSVAEFDMVYQQLS